MDKLIGIFQQLGVDSSIFIQFIIFTVIFLLLKMLLFNKLLFVLQLRESKTTKLDEEANDTFSKAETLAEEYHQKIAVIHDGANSEASSRKEKIKSSEDEKLKATTEQILKEYEDKKVGIIDRAQAQGKELLSSSKNLTDDLVSKFLN